MGLLQALLTRCHRACEILRPLERTKSLQPHREVLRLPTQQKLPQQYQYLLGFLHKGLRTMHRQHQERRRLPLLLKALQGLQLKHAQHLEHRLQLCLQKTRQTRREVHPQQVLRWWHQQLQPDRLHQAQLTNWKQLEGRLRPDLQMEHKRRREDPRRLERMKSRQLHQVDRLRLLR